MFKLIGVLENSFFDFGTIFSSVREKIVLN